MKKDREGAEDDLAKHREANMNIQTLVQDLKKQLSDFESVSFKDKKELKEAKDNNEYLKKQN